MGPKVTVVSTSDGWDAVYIDGKLAGSGAMIGLGEFFRIIDEAGVKVGFDLELGELRDELDEQAQWDGTFPNNLSPEDWI